MEHHVPTIEETEKEVCFQTIALLINTIEVLIHQWTISNKNFLRSSTTIVPLFSFTNIPWTAVISTLIHHQSCLLSSRHANQQAILMCWDAKKQQGTDSSCVTIELYLCKTSLFTLSKWKMLYLPSTGFDFGLIDSSHYLQKQCLPNQQAINLWR